MRNLAFRCTDNKTISPGHDQILNTTDGYSCRTLKYATTGSWYGEGTHISGDNGYYFGFSTDCGLLLFYAERTYSKYPNIYREGCFTSTGQIERENLTFLSSSVETIGVLLNIRLQLFTVFHQNSFFTHHFSPTKSRLKYSFIFGGGKLQTANDTIKINLGTKPFKYNIPSLAFINQTSKLSCYSRPRIPLGFILNFFSRE